MKITYRREAGRHQLTLEGHADFGKEDIVCAAASCLFYSLYSACAKKDSDLRGKAQWGDSYIICARNMHCDNYFEMAEEGFEALSEQYPKNVKFLKIVKDI